MNEAPCPRCDDKGRVAMAEDEDPWSETCCGYYAYCDVCGLIDVSLPPERRQRIIDALGELVKIVEATRRV